MIIAYLIINFVKLRLKGIQICVIFTFRLSLTLNIHYLGQKAKKIKN